MTLKWTRCMSPMITIDPDFLWWPTRDEFLGCGGIGPLKGGDSRTCELRKMYFLKETRGLGLGAQMLNICLDEARRLGYQECYLETLHRMDRARSLYLKNGFIELSAPKGSTGHGACELSYLKDLRS